VRLGDEVGCGVGLDGDLVEFFLDGLGVVGEEDGVAEAFAHFVDAVEAWQACDAADFGFGYGEEAAVGGVLVGGGAVVDAAVELVELAGDVAAHFDVCFLVFADGDEFGSEGEDVSALADGVHGEAEGVGVAEAFGVDLGFEGGVAHDLVEGDEHGEEKCKFGDSGDLALEDEGGAFGVEADGEPVFDYAEGVGADVGWSFGERGEGVYVGDEEVAVVVVLEVQAVFEAADVVAEVEACGGGGVAGEQAWACGVGHRGEGSGWGWGCGG